MKELSPRQIEVLNYIKNFHAEENRLPTVRECAKHFTVSIKAAHDYFLALRRKGYLEASSSETGLTETNEQQSGLIPLLGDIAAGLPVLVQANEGEQIAVPQDVIRGKSCFALRVQGDSMKDAGIFDGDIAIIEQSSVATNGDIVVALLEDRATLKYFYKEINRAKLVAANEKYPPIYTSEIQILGRLCGLIRKY